MTGRSTIGGRVLPRAVAERGAVELDSVAPINRGTYVKAATTTGPARTTGRLAYIDNLRVLLT
jgi:hypothetical protein